MDDRDIAQQRLRNQGLANSPFAEGEDVVRWLVAMQSQEYGVAKWSIGQRARALTDAAVDRAMRDGAILRTHVLRPTWHFVLPADIRWILQLTAPRVHAMNAHYYRKLGLDDAVFARSNALIARALEAGNHRTRSEIATLLDDAGIAARGMTLAYLLMHAELDAIVCSGAPRGKQHTYALLDERAPAAASLTRDEALAELTTRYFTSRGPATLKDYGWWSSLTAADARRGVELLGSRLERLVTGGRTYWFVGARPRTNDVAPAVHLLQGYDEYIVAYSESKAVLAGDGARLVPQDRSRFTHAIVLNGHVVGHWRRVHRTRAVTIEAQLLRSVDGAQRDALQAAVDRYGRFVEMPAALVLAHASPPHATE